MKALHFYWISTGGLYLFGAWCLAADATGTEEEELALVYGDKSFVSIATGDRQPISRAPSVATVITAEEIASGGYTDLDQVLESVPGLHVGHTELSNEPVYEIRGITSKRNPEVLMLLNGQAMTSPFLGNRGDIWGGMPLEHVARIEVIRGPGSALYGADAYSGVINVITKDADQINGTNLGVRGGSYDSVAGWIQHGGHWGDVAVSAYLNVERTHGANPTIDADAQTFLDGLFHSHASLAPGPENNAYHGLDFHFDATWQGWRLRLYEKRRDDMGSGAGIAAALDPNGWSYSHISMANLGYQGQAGNWAYSAEGDYYWRAAKSYLYVFPAGAFGGLYPDGMIGGPGKWERRSAISGSATYSGWRNHRLRLGIGGDNTADYATSEVKNFQFVGTFPQPLGSVVDVSNTNLVYLKPHSRRLVFGYAQDEWTFSKDWTLTAGVRHDHYSDFGSTTNPRLALVWAAGYDLTAKLLYGRAYRAPSFVEQYIINNPVTQGNPNARPERISTSEAAVSWQPSGTVKLDLSIFDYRRSDMLQYVPATVGNIAENVGAARGNGFEIEANWDPAKQVHIAANFSHQRSRDDATDKDMGIVPHNHAYARVDLHLGGDWSVSNQVDWVGGRNREPADVRSSTVRDYTTYDLSLHRGASTSKWEAWLTVRNLFNADAREPSFAPGTDLPHDLPVAKRNWEIAARFHF